jgi:hypothetical protein
MSVWTFRASRHLEAFDAFLEGRESRLIRQGYRRSTRIHKMLS